MSKFKVTPLWSKKAQKILIDKDMSKKELAATLKVNYNQMLNVMTGTVYNASIQTKICQYLGIEE